MAFGDVFAGWMDAAHEHHTNVLQMEYQSRKETAQMYAKMADDPRYDEASQNEFKRRALILPTIEYGKKVPKELMPDKDGNIIMKVQPPAPAPVGIPGSQIPGAPIQTGLGPGPVPEKDAPPGPDTSLYSLQGTRPTAGVEIPRQEIQAPGPPPHELMEQMPFAQQMDRLRQRSMASTAMIKEGLWKPVGGGGFNQDGADGKRHKFINESRLNTDTGTQEYRSRDLGPVSDFAPRLGDIVTLEDAKEFASPGGGGFKFRNQEGQDLDLDSMIATDGPTATIQSMGNYYKPVSVRNVFIRANNQVQAVNPLAPKAPPTIMGTARPETTRTSWRPSGVDAYGRQLFEEFDSTTNTATGQRSTNPPQQQPAAPQSSAPTPQAPPATGASAPQGAPPAQAPMPPSPAIQQLMKTPASGTTMQAPAPPLVPRGTQAIPAPSVSTPSAGGRVRTGGLALGAQERGQQIMLAVAPAAQILYGDPKNPDFESLQSFANMADDPEASERIGTAARFIIERLNKVNAEQGPGAVNLLIGGALGKTAMNALGLTRLMAGSETKSMQDVLTPLHDNEAKYLARIMAAYGTVVGLRRFTGAGAYEFSTAAMERELPVPGLTGIKNSLTVYAKLAQLAEEISAATGRLDPSLVPERPFYQDAAKQLTWRSNGWGVAKGKEPGSYLVQKTISGPWERP